MPSSSRRRRRQLVAAGATATAALVTAAILPGGTSLAATFGTPVVVSGADASEPGVDVAPDGTLYVNAPVGVLSNIPGSPSNVYRSTNGGTTWTRLPAGLKANQP